MKRLILLVLVVLAAAMAARADIIYVQGDVSGTWAADTVMVTGEVRVPPDSTLVIEPGVKVLFAGNFALEIQENSILHAVGTDTDSIYFTALDTAICHHGLHFISASDSSILKYCSISYGEASVTATLSDSCGGGIFCYNSSIELTNSCISNCHARYEGGGVYLGDYSNALIAYNNITENSAERGCGLYCTRSMPIVYKNIINSNYNTDHALGGGIYCDNCTIRIECNSISHNLASAGGIELFYCRNSFILNNIISQNEAGGFLGNSGGIQCLSSNALIYGNLICQNTTTSGYPNYAHGGGLNCSSYFSYDSATVRVIRNIIMQNSAEDLGGGIYFASIANGEITENIIYNNVGKLGGGVYISGAGNNSPVVGNYFINNFAQGSGTGGGIQCNYSISPVIENRFFDNHATSGGAACAQNGQNLFIGNCIAGNYATEEGSALYSWNGAELFFIKNTIYFNDPTSMIYAYWYANPTLCNCVLGPSGNISPSSIEITYSDILMGWPGMGNISLDPAFVDTVHDDYRLLWGSPCIDAGHPDSLDPDGTRADMGAFYYDQSKPVRILLTPHEIPFLIPDCGGTMTYTLRLDTHLEEPQVATFWCDVTLPDSSILGPVLGPATVEVLPNQMVSWVRYQGVPGTAPLGVSHYNAYAVVGSDTSRDSFMFGVMGFGSEIQDPWENWGDPLGVPPAPLVRPGIPAKFALHPAHPNPFNAITRIRFDLPVAGRVKLEVFDIFGRTVSSGSGTTPTTGLVNGWMAAGSHNVVFDGTELPSGIYICRLQAENFEAVQKMVLLK